MITRTTCTNQEAAYLAALTGVAPAYVVGIVDAQKGEAMRPDLYIKDGDQAEYEQGYRDETAAIRLFGKDGELRDAELEEYREEMEDRLYHARGMY